MFDSYSKPTLVFMIYFGSLFSWPLYQSTMWNRCMTMPLPLSQRQRTIPTPQDPVKTTTSSNPLDIYTNQKSTCCAKLTTYTRKVSATPTMFCQTFDAARTLLDSYRSPHWKVVNPASARSSTGRFNMSVISTGWYKMSSSTLRPTAVTITAWNKL